MKLIEVLFYLYLLLKPYYIFKSGSIQIGDIILFVAFLLYILSTQKNKKNIKQIIIDNKEFVIFVIIATIINLTYYLFLRDFQFVLSSFYYIFNFFTLVLFIGLYKNKSKFKININRIFKLNLLIQLFLSIFSLGKVYGEFRWMGTFNDPNQFAFYVFISYCFIYVLNYINNNTKDNLFFMFISLYLIVESCSTGMLLGMIIYVIMSIFQLLKKLYKLIYVNFKKIVLLILFLTPIITISFLYKSLDLNENDKNPIFSEIVESDIIVRVKDKLNRLDNDNTNGRLTIWQERGYDKLLIYPQYLIYGSGEGAYYRFDKSAHLGEIHATIPGVAFYYGLIPLMLISYWIFSKIRKSKYFIFLLYGPILAESFFLLNSRQSLFWILIALGPYIDFKKEIVVKNEKNQ